MEFKMQKDVHRLFNFLRNRWAFVLFGGRGRDFKARRL